ncbi:MAG: TetR/AcrR family transcriptional regulator [Anaerolineae bacterium]|nr:TetR/AcrR family transcriptional regulator [Anaerolineae bacterium]
MDKIDRRIKRTQKLLAEALVTLASQQGYDAVTIKDITDYADISYSTFFRHYPDKDTLLMGILQSVVEEMRELVRGRYSPEKSGTILFEHVAENHDLYQVLLGGLNSSAMVQQVQSLIAAEVLPALNPLTDELIPREIVANHVAASALALVKWWLDHQMPYPAEQMGSIYAALVVAPMSKKNVAE